MKLALYIACSLFFVSFAYGQRVNMYWEDDTVAVGEHAVLHIDIDKKPKQWDYRPLSGSFTCKIKNAGENLWKPGGELEILNFSDTLLQKSNGTNYQGKYRVVAWDSALYKLPELWFVHGDTSFSKQVPVLTVLFKKKKVKDGIIEIDIQPDIDIWLWLKTYWWIFAVPAVIVVFAILWNRKRKMKPKRTLSLRERTLLAIQELKKKEDWNHGREKQHYSAFTSILKSYVGVRYEVHLMERTTQETKLLLQKRGLEPAIINRILELLQEADLIKFAKVAADDLQARSSLKKLEELVRELSPLEIPV